MKAALLTALFWLGCATAFYGIVLAPAETAFTYTMAGLALVFSAFNLERASR